MTANTEIRAADVADSTVTVRGSKVHLLTAGTGDPILYLHGSGDLGGWLPARFLAAAWSLNRVARDRHARLCPCCGSNPGPRQRSKPMSAIILISLAAVAHRVWSADTYVGSGA